MYSRTRSNFPLVAGILLGVVLSLCWLQWVLADEDVTVNATVPAICGNGAVEGAEACDGADINNQTCVAQGFDGGNISCNADCTLNTTQCTNEEEGGGGGGGNPAPPPPPPPPPGEEPPAEDPPAEEPPVEDPPAEEPPAEEPPVDEPPVEDPPAEDPPAEEPPVEEPPVEDPPAEEPPAEEPPVEEPPAEEPPAEQPPAEEPGDVAVEPPGGDPQAPAPNLGPPPQAAPAQGQPAEQGPLRRIGGGGRGGHPLQARYVFWIAERSIEVESDARTITSVAGDIVTIALRQSARAEQVEQAMFTFNGTDEQFRVDERDGRLYLDTRMPVPGVYTARITTQFENDTIDQQEIRFVSKPLGTVRSRKEEAPVIGARVTLYEAETNAIWNAAPFGQQNPVTIGEGGVYGFIVPNGQYRLVVEAEGYRTRETFTFAVRDHVVNEQVMLIATPPELSDVRELFASDAPTLTKVTEAASVIGDIADAYTAIGIERTKDAVRKVDDVSDDPQVEAATEEVVAPSVAGVAAVAVVPSMWTNVLLFLRYLFLQPLLLLGRRRRKAWGVVYNSLTKLPVDLAVVRLVDAKTNKVQQSRVTDGQGRFLFLSEPGSYKIEVTKPGFAFPTAVLQGVTADGDFLDIYHGEPVEVTGSGIGITPNIPVDPSGADQPPKRIIKERRWRRAQHAISLSGIILAGVSLYVTPSLIVGTLLAVHLGMYAGFVRFVKPKKPKGWGIVSDASARAPIAGTVVRLFTKEYNKLVATQVTDGKGRYAFLVGPNEYYVKMEKSGYTPFKSEDIVVKGEQAKKGAVLKKDVAMEKHKGTE